MIDTEKPVAPDDDLLTTKQAADWLDLELNTLAIWRMKCIGPPWIEISRGCIRYRRGDVRQWLAARRRATEDAA